MIMLGHIRVHLEPNLDWQMYGLTRPALLFAGRDSYPALVYAVEVKPRVLETDPGPLDARVS